MFLLTSNISLYFLFSFNWYLIFSVNAHVYDTVLDAKDKE